MRISFHVVTCLKTANLLVKCLENETVDFVFGIPGEENLDVMDALKDSSIRFILTRHEGAASFMADIYGRITGRAGVCLSTLGPGATNLVTGVADAYTDRSPLVAITAQEELSLIHKESHQYLDVLELLEPITKWNARIESPESTPEIVRKAFKIAQAEKPGSTHIELSSDVAEAQSKGKPLRWDVLQFPSPDIPSLETAAELIAKSKTPVVLAGNGVIRGKASEALTQFAEKLGIPVAHTLMGKGSIPWTSPMSLLTVGLQLFDYRQKGFDVADLVICVGYDMVEYDPKHWNPSKDKKIIHIDFTPAEISANYVTDVEIVADIRETLQLLAERFQTPKDAVRVKTLRDDVLNHLESWREGRRGFFKPQTILKELRSVMAPEDVLVCDVGAHKIWVGRFFQALKPNTVIISNGLSSMGIALPGGLAAKLAQPDCRVVTVSGDGGFMMSVHELETARREKLAAVNIIFRDEGLGVIKWKQMDKFGRTFGTDFTNPDFVQLAKAFGIRGYEVTDSSDLASIFEEAINLDEPSVIDIPVDYSDNPLLIEEMGHVLKPT